MENQGFSAVSGCWLVQTYGLARRNDSGLPKKDKPCRFPPKPEVIWGISVKEWTHWDGAIWNNITSDLNKNFHTDDEPDFAAYARNTYCAFVIDDRKARHRGRLGGEYGASRSEKRNRSSRRSADRRLQIQSKGNLNEETYCHYPHPCGVGRDRGSAASPVRIFGQKGLAPPRVLAIASFRTLQTNRPRVSRVKSVVWGRAAIEVLR